MTFTDGFAFGFWGTIGYVAAQAALFVGVVAAFVLIVVVVALWPKKAKSR